MDRRAAAAVVAIVGVVLIGVTLGAQLFHRAPPFDQTTSDFHRNITPRLVADLRGDISRLEAAGAEFQRTVVPTLAQQLGITPAELVALVEQRFPAVARGTQAIPVAVPRFDRIVDLLASERERLEKADAIPTDDRRATTVPWAIVVAGSLLVLLAPAVAMGRTGAAVAALLGVALVAVPLALSLPSKSTAADTLNDNIAPVFNRQEIDAAKVAVGTLGEMVLSFQTQMLPAIAQQLGVPPQQLAASLGPRFPALSTAVATFPEASLRFERVIGIFERNLANFQTFSPVRLAPIAWTVVGGGAAATAAGIWAFASAQAAGIPGVSRRRRMQRERRAA